ncbi:copper chaperone PCu(A)C [Agromyces soli]|uniref:Copper chaperone PCu(A)C n=1 Tax=Agromyces soli TaxID=659012 RepID=A0ABY4AYJ0_9MICO|nr:copper chaperone PCu(A)C [Agromyces soli]UOE27181.1 copper chaperone PCu(A)C [Agromyces soli]
MNTAPTTTARTRRTAGLALAAATALLLSACAGAAAPTPSTEPTATEASQLTVTDAWVKAGDEAMSAAFGELENTGPEPITIVSAETGLAGRVELHETVENETGEMVMREKDGGFVIPAGGSLSLAPGGTHLMLMELGGPILAGEEYVFTLGFADGSSSTFTAPAKDYAGANENYEGGDMDGMDMGDAGHGSGH